MGAFEKDQQRLQQLLQECLSDEDDAFEPDGTSDEYEPDASETSDSDSEGYQPPNKKVKVRAGKLNVALQDVEKDNLGPSTSTGVATNSQQSDNPSHNIDETIENVIRQMQTLSSSSDEEDDQNANNYAYQWEPVTGRHLKTFSFDEEHTGFQANLYEIMFDKNPYDFYKLFVNDDIINLMVSSKFSVSVVLISFLLLGY